MLQNIKNFYGKRLATSDGDIGRVQDFYFDDHSWAVRYLVVDTETWLTGRMVLLSPHAFGHFDGTEENLPIHLTRKQIENSPSMDAHPPVSRQYEEEYYRYYGLPVYWQGDQLWGGGGYPVMSAQYQELSTHTPPLRADRHLRSTRAITGYAIQATDGTIGHLTDLKVDDESWAIREAVVEAGHWYSGKEIGITPERIERISYEESKIFVNLTKEDIERTAENGVARAGWINPKNPFATHE